MNMEQHEVRNLIRLTCRAHKVSIADGRVTALAHQAVTTCPNRNAAIDFLARELKPAE